MTQSIFGPSTTPQPISIVRPRGCELAPVRTSHEPTWSRSSDVALLAILGAPLRAGETVAGGFARKEVELRHVLGTLSVNESRTLHSRLSYPKPGDVVAESFQRLTGERRARLLAFIADARRREAIGGR